MIAQIGFGVVAAALLYSALRVVTTRNMVHTVLWLGLMLSVTSVLYVMLKAPFMAAIQLLLYTGGVLTLMLFGLMLTRRDDDLDIANESHSQVLGGATAAAVFGIFFAAVIKTDTLPNVDAPPVSVQAIGAGFLTQHLLAFEVLSFLLLAVVVGAIVLARHRCPAPLSRSALARIPARRREEP